MTLLPGNSRWTSRFQLLLAAFGKCGLKITRFWAPVPSGIDADATCVGTWAGNPPEPPALLMVSNGKFEYCAWNGGSARTLPNALPNVRSWKIPNPARIEVLPLLHGSHVNPKRGSMSL